MNINPAKTITPEECKFIVILGTHQGDSPLTVEQIHRRMVPQGVNEKNLMEMGFVRHPTDRNGRPMKGVLELTPQGRDEIGYWIPRCLKMLDDRMKRPHVPEQAEIDAAFKRWLERYRPTFAVNDPVLTAQAKPAGPDKVSKTGRKRRIPPAVKPGVRTTTREDVDEPQDDDASVPVNLDGDGEGETKDAPRAAQEPPKRKPGRPRNPRPVR